MSQRPAWRGVYIRMEGGIDRAVNQRVHALAGALLELPLAGISDIIPSYNSLYVEYDANRVSETTVRHWCKQQRPQQTSTTLAPPKTVPVRYDGEDLAEVADKAALSVHDVIALHSRPDYHVYALGFTPGFAFMGSVPKAIHMPRRSTPRVRIPAHSVAMTGSQTGIYPSVSPGGWNLLGHALVAMYDPHRDMPFWLEPGDTVRFLPQEGEAPADVTPLRLLPEQPDHAVLEVTKAGLLDIVVDGGRVLAGRYGLCRGGMLDAVSGTLANRLVGNDPFAPVVEMSLMGGSYQAVSPCVVAVAGWGMQAKHNGQDVVTPRSFYLEVGDELTFIPSSTGVRSYLAVAGGIASDRFMGSSSVDLKGNIGTPLKAGDVLGVREVKVARASRMFHPWHAPRDAVSLRITPGPQASKDALNALTKQTFTVSHADRMGLRLADGDVPGGELTSEAVPIGAIQVPPGAHPILLLHDRGTIGGYHKPALLHPADLPRAAQIRQGQTVRFRLLDEAYLLDKA